MNRAVWLPNWIGDAVMATPALRALREQDPGGSLTAIARAPVDTVFHGSPLLDRVILDESDSKRSWGHRAAFVKKLRGEEFEEIILLTNSLRTAVVARLAGIPKRIGFRRDGRSWLLTDRLEPFSRTIPNPVIDEYNRLAEQATGQPLSSADRYRLQLEVTREDEMLWDDFASRHCLDVGHYVCLNSGGAFGAAKHWPVESFSQLALKIAKEQELPLVMICGPAEKELAREFEQQTQHPRIFSLADEAPSIGFSKAMVKNAGWMITTDSGPRHFAHAFGVPVLTLYGPTHIEWSETYYEQAIATQLDVDCGPCQQRTCPLKHHRCMKDLTVERVYQDFCRLQQLSFKQVDAGSSAA